VCQSSVEAIKWQFNQGVDQVKCQPSSTSEEMFQIPKRDGSGVSATLSTLKLCLVFDNYMHGAVVTSSFDLINSIERMASILEGSIRDSK
jgi:hypothetical protein